MQIRSTIELRQRFSRAEKVLGLQGISRAAYRLALVAFLCLVGDAHAARAAGPLAGLARVVPERTVAPRLSISSVYRPCALTTAAGGTIPRADCHFPRERLLSGRFRSHLARASAAVADSLEPDALRAGALARLIASGGSGNSLQAAISDLETAARLAERPAPVMADLAAAILVRAEVGQNARDLFEALEIVEQAFELEPRNPAVLFNRALALDRLELHTRAAEAWEAFIMVEPGSGWAEEARGRVRELAKVADPRPLPAPGAPAAEVEAYVAASPQEARLQGWNHVLGEWGDAVLRGDPGTATDRLRLAEALGRALERRRGGDATLAAAVRAIRAHAHDHAATRTLAEAHREFAAGQRAFLPLEFEAAGPHFERILALRPPSRPLSDWAVLFHAAVRVLTGREEQYRQAREILEPLAARADTLRDPALAGRAHWALATTLLRLGQREPALAEAQTAARHLERAGEAEHVGGAGYLAAELEFNLGATTEAYASIHDALTRLRPYRRSTWLCNLLGVAATTAEADGFGRAAARLQEERVAVARGTDLPVFLAEAHLARARTLIAVDSLSPARAEIAAGENQVRRLRPGRTRSWLHTDLRLARAAALARRDPPRAAALLDTVAADSTGVRTPLRQLRVRLDRAEVRLAMGDMPGAVADLDTVTGRLAAERSAVRRARLRASLADAARRTFERLALLKLASGDTLGALAYLDRGRASFATADGASAGTPERGWRMPPRRVAVVHALVGDTLLIWTVADSTVRLARRTVDRAALARTADRVRSVLARRSREDVRGELERLHGWLIGPVRRRLGGEGTELVLVTDGVLAGIPFAALRDPAGGRYLVQDHPLRSVGSLRDAARRPGGGRLAAVRALLVADPAFDARAFPGLERLRGARAEVDSIAAAYGDRTVLADTAADRRRVSAALAGAGVVHFAGHAILDDARPERSHLVLAPERGAANPGRLAAIDVEGMDLRDARLVVLSACQTLRSRDGRSGGFAGFAAALLGAGAGGLVGSLWPVDDELTIPLMTEFHRAYRESGDASLALRSAQLLLLRSPNPALRSPAAWAGFQYAGS